MNLVIVVRTYVHVQETSTSTRTGDRLGRPCTVNLPYRADVCEMISLSQEIVYG